MRRIKNRNQNVSNLTEKKDREKGTKIELRELRISKYRVVFWGFCFCIIYFPRGEWAEPGSSAIAGQPVARKEQAHIPWPRCKNQFNIQAPQ